jgi:hypothetical protein
MIILKDIFVTHLMFSSCHFQYFQVQNIKTRHIKAVILSVKSTQIFHENVKFSYTVEPV